MQEWEFKAHIQGHFQVLDAPNEPARRSLLSSRHYSDYEISDRAIAQQGGKRKGIKLGHAGIVPIEVFQSAWQRQAQPTAAGTKVPKRKPTTIQIYKDTQARWKSVLEAIAPDGTQLEKTQALLLWMEQQLQEQSQPQPMPEPAIEQQEQEMPPITPTLDVSQSNELRALIEAIVSQQLQAHSRQSMPQSHSTEYTHPAALTVAVDPTPATPTPIQETSQPPQTADAPRGRQASAQVESRVNRAIDLIMKHNDAPDRRHDEKWEITIRSLKTLGCAQTAIYRIWETRKAAIEHHHQQHGISQGHNTRHRGKITIEEVVHLD